MSPSFSFEGEGAGGSWLYIERRGEMPGVPVVLPERAVGLRVCVCFLDGSVSCTRVSQSC